MPFFQQEEWKRKHKLIFLVLTLLCIALLSTSTRQLHGISDAVISTPLTATTEETRGTSRQSTDGEPIPITPETPLFVLSLPNSGSTALYRYFKCAGFQPNQELGRYFANQKKGRPLRALNEIGRCLRSNMENKQPPLYMCSRTSTGKPFSVWLDMEVTSFNRCFYPALAPGVLEALYQNYSQATILQITRHPGQWYETLSFDIREKWNDMCNENHPGVTFPARTSSKDQWIQFYNYYIQHIRDFAGAHPSMNYIEINLDSKDAGDVLQARLDIDKDCWTNSYGPRIPNATQQEQESDALAMPPRPADITYPALLVSMSKSGTTTTHDYFQCGLGGGASIHQWTKNHTTKQTILVGKCMEYNIQNNRPLLYDCSYYRVWTDIQYVLRNGGRGNAWSQAKCFFPQFVQNGGLQSFYQSYPHGTIMNTIRNATSWFRSANRWNQIQERWAGGADCHGFPPPNSSEETWVEFYNHQNDQVRQFARDHPSLTYVEVSLESEDTPRILEDIFGFPEYCWGHSNVNQG
jgi:hypothetical protein